jgi:hypothetical protein
VSGGGTRRSGTRGTLAIVVGLVIVAVVLGGALALVAPQGGGSASPTSPPVSAPAASAGSGASASASSSPSAAFASSAPSGPKAAIDPTLLHVLPPTVGGVSNGEFAEGEQQADSDPDLGRNVSRFATAFAGDAKGTNWVYSAVMDVRPEAQTSAFYSDWQESFDASACQQAGGVTGHTTVTIAGRDVERTACGAGVRTYHTKLPNGILVSVSDFGPGNWGEAELAALQP